MSSNSVWYREVDTSLISLLKKLIDPEIKVYFNTERDLLDDKIKYPYAKIHHLGERFAIERYNPHQQVTNLDVDGGEITLEDSALPYDLSYQVELISNSNNLHNTVSFKWSSKVKPFFTLRVVDTGGVERHCFVSSERPVAIQEEAKDDKVAFRYIIRLRVRVELDENTPITSKLATGGLTINNI